MRHPPSPLLLSARRRRPRRNPPRGAQLGSPTPGEQRAEQKLQQSQSQVPGEECALLSSGRGPGEQAAHAHDATHEQDAAKRADARHAHGGDDHAGHGCEEAAEGDMPDAGHDEAHTHGRARRR